MSSIMVRWVLWISLMILMPLPVCLDFDSNNVFAILPMGCLIQGAFYSIFSDVHLLHANKLIYPQLVIWSALLYIVAIFYETKSLMWPAKLRGSIMSLVVFSCLIIFSSMPTYLYFNDNQRYTFLEIYEPLKMAESKL